MISQFINPAKRKKKLLGDLYNFPKGTMAIGRLDVPSEGLLLLTTDGKVSAEIRSHKYEKEYYVQVDGIITQKEIEQLKNGVEIGFNGKKYKTKPGRAFLINDPKFPLRSQKIRDERHGPTSWVSIVIKEGKFRQVRKMTAAVGFPTLRLIRIRIGEIKLDDLEIGGVKE
ncbi:MAG: pseudouridine synthase, partial [Polaribacter sp.]|nr:pseudouridine synthase [Polaribacter sp.]